jgi:hypothetical protein
MRQEVKAREIAIDVVGKHFFGAFPLEGGEYQCDQAAHDVRIAVDAEMELALCVACGIEPHLALASAHQPFLASVGLGHRWDLPAEFDDVAIPVFPAVEKTESIDDVGIVAILHTASTIVGRLFFVFVFSFHST